MPFYQPKMWHFLLQLNQVSTMTLTTISYQGIRGTINAETIQKNCTYIYVDI